MAPEGLSQQQMAQRFGISPDEVSGVLRELEEKGFVDGEGCVTELGMDALAPYRVESAVILAAGPAARFAPLSYERPKAMFEVRGEVLIERLIRQIKEAGINDITVVVGFMKESFFYLEDDFGVKMVINPEYATRNNHASLLCARKALGNSYVCNADEYYTENVFDRYVFRPYCSGCVGEGVKDEVVFTVGENGRITEMGKGGGDVVFSRGPAYFDRSFSDRFMRIIESERDELGTESKLWEEVLAGHLEELEVYLRVCEAGTVFEFDYITDLIEFDRDFFANVDSRILDNIAETLNCSRSDITDVRPMSAGLTNLSTLFSVGGKRYVYRHPGNGTDEIISRQAEAHALAIARELGLDDTFIYEQPDEGWKISLFIEGCSELDYSNRSHVEKALQMARLLHTSGKTSPWSFDFFDEGINIAQMLKDMRFPLPRDFDALADRVAAVAKLMKEEAGDPVLCHNDFYGPNFLVRGDEMRLIDWEYAAMGDPICDIGNFVSQGSGYTVEETLDILPLYYGREATEQEQRHCLAAVGLVGWYWYVWAMYKEAMGNPVGEWLYVWYKAAKQFTAAAEPLYGIVPSERQ